MLFRDKRHFIMIRGLTHQEDIMIINIHVLNHVPKYMKQNLTELKEKTDNLTIIETSIFHLQ